MRLVLVVFYALVLCASATAESVPVEYQHDRIFVRTEAPDGSLVSFFTDSGGGFNAVTESMAHRLSLTEVSTVSIDGEERSLVEFPTFLELAGIPPPAAERWLNGGLVVVSDAKLEEHGLLGSRWFEGKIWYFDYSEGTLRSSTGLALDSEYQSTSIGFRSDEDGVRDLSFPRISIVVEGETLDMLLDTGATARLTDSSADAFGLPPGTRVGTSYISKPIFNSWMQQNPDWKVVDKGEDVTGHIFPMIEVPEVTIAGITVGPVWFVQRPEGTFEEWISQMTDSQVVGAVGGSLFRYFRMVIDYPDATAYFQPLKTRNISDVDS